MRSEMVTLRAEVAALKPAWPTPAVSARQLTTHDLLPLHVRLSSPPASRSVTCTTTPQGVREVERSAVLIAADTNQRPPATLASIVQASPAEGASIEGGGDPRNTGSNLLDPPRQRGLQGQTTKGSPWSSAE